MARHLLSRLPALLLPLGLFSAPAMATGGYQRSYHGARGDAHVPSFQLGGRVPAAGMPPPSLRTLPEKSEELSMVASQGVRELVILDSAVRDKAAFYRGARPGVEIVEIDASKPGLEQLKQVLAAYQGLSALHIVSHAEEGVLLLGNSRVDANTLKEDVATFAALQGALAEGADLLLYGCDLAKGIGGEALLDILHSSTHLDIAASNNLTGNPEQGADWALEIQRGRIETDLAFSEKALKDFTDVLAPVVHTLSAFAYRATNATANCPSDRPTYTFNYLSVDSANYIGCGFMHNNGYGGTTVGLINYFGISYSPAFLTLAGANQVNQGTVSGTNHIEIRKRTGSFQLTNVVADEFAGTTVFTNVRITGYPAAGGAPIVSTAITSDTSAASTFTFALGGALSSFAGVNLSKFRLTFVNQSGSSVDYMRLVNFTSESSDVTGPTVSMIPNQNIAPGGNTGALAFTVGDDFSPTSGVSVTRASSNTTAVPLANVVLGGSGTNRTVTVTGAAAGTSTITITATDRSGNITNRTFDVVVADPNAPPTDITLSNSTVNHTGGTNALVGSLSSTDPDVGNTFTYTLVAGAGDTHNASFNISGSQLRANNPAALPAGSYSVRVRTTDNANATYEEAFTITVVDDVVPTVAQVTSSTANGTYKVGDAISIQVAFAEPVTVTGTPTLALNSGGTAMYASGSGGNTLTFNYTVQAGHSASDLDYASTSALALGAGSIQDSAGNNATLALAAPAAAGSLGASKNIVVDGVVPTVSGATSSNANGTYKVGDAISVQIGFSEAVLVTGTPQLTLETGMTDRVINYSSGSGTAALTFSYVVQAGDESADLDYLSVAAFSANGGTVRDAAGNNATLTLAPPGAAGSLGASKNIVVDGALPTVTGVTSSTTDGTYKVGDVIAIQVSFAEAVTVTGAPTLALNSGGTASFVSGSGSNTLTFNYTVQVGHSTADLDYASTSALALGGGTIRDAAGNNATLTLAAPGTAGSLGANKNIVIDAVVPAVTGVTSSTANGTYKVGDVIAIQVSFAEAVTVTGTPTLALNSGGTASFASGSGSNALTFNYTVQAGHSAADLDYASTSALALSGGTIQDTAGNNATLTLAAPGTAGSLGANKNIVIDAMVPAVTGVTSSTANGTYKVGDVIAIQVSFAEAVTVAGVPTLALNSGGTASFASGSGSNTLTFNYTVQAGHSTADLDYANTSALALSGGTIQDTAGNNATLTLAAPGTAGSLGAAKALVIDGIAPTVNSIAVVGAPGPTATSVNFLVTFSESVTNVSVDDFELTFVGVAAGTVASVSGSGSVYTATVNGISGTGSLRLDLKAGTNITDAAGNSSPAFTGGGVHSLQAVPGAPTGASATASPGQATVTFVAPASDGGSAITRYTATATPGGQSGYCDIATGSAAGTVCTVTVAGLTNGTSYTFRVRASNANGDGGDSIPSNAAVPRLLQIATTPGAVPGMAGVATAILSGGGGTCTLQPGGGGGFGPANQVPPGFQAPHGQFAFAATQCVGTVTLTLQYPQSLPTNIRFRKPDGAGGWFDPQDAGTSLNVTISQDRHTVTYDITDDGLGDTERTTPGAIADPFVPVILAAPTGAQGIPTLGTWGLALLSTLAGLLGMRQAQRRSHEFK